MPSLEDLPTLDELLVGSLSTDDLVPVWDVSSRSIKKVRIDTFATDEEAATPADVAGQIEEELDSVLSRQLHSVKKADTWFADSGTSTPLRIATCGDSLAAQGLRPIGPHMGSAGIIGLGPVSGGAGTVTFNSTGLGGGANHNFSISGAYYEHAIGSEREWTRGASATGDVIGNKGGIWYVKRPGGGTFKLQTRAQGETAWVDLATIDTADATTFGVFTEYNLAGNNVYNRLRITDVTVGSVIIYTAGIYCSNGGGVIEIGGHVLTRGGATPTDFGGCPAAVFDPFWAGLSPDLVLSCWNDSAANWLQGGEWDLLYDRMVAQKAATDHIVCSAFPTSSEPEEIVYAAARPVQRDWCERNGHSFFDLHKLFFSDFAQADAAGFMGDAVHPSTTGRLYAMRALWLSTQIGRMALGGAMNVGESVLIENVGASAPATNRLRFKAGIEIIAAAGIRLRNAITTRFTHFWDIKPLGDNINLEIIQGNNVRAAHFVGNGHYRGVSPYQDAYNHLGSPNRRWRSVFAAAENWRQQTKTASYTVDSDATVGNRPYDHTIFCDATAGAMTITLPAAGLTSDSESINNGRVLIIKKIDFSANAVTIDGNAAETIDGAATLDLTTQWQSVTLQCNGTSWFVVSKN